jgi:type II secretory pathway component PulK
MIRTLRRSGVALLFVLGAVILLSVVATTLHTSTLETWRTARRELDRGRAEATAWSGLALAAELLAQDDRAYFFFPEDGRVPLGPDGKPMALSELEEAYLRLSSPEPLVLDGVELQVDIADESGYLNLNRTPGGNLKRLLGVLSITPVEASPDPGATPEAFADLLTAAFEDWRDPDDTPRPGGAERQEYESSEPFPYRPRNGPLLTASELSLVYQFRELNIWEGTLAPLEGAEGFVGADGEVPMARGPALMDLLTVHGVGAQVNVNEAPESVLASLPGIYESAARDSIVALIMETRPFKQLGEVRSRIDALDPNASRQVGPWLTLRSQYYRLTSTATVRGSARVEAQLVVRKLPGGRMQRVSYRER